MGFTRGILQDIVSDVKSQQAEAQAEALAESSKAGSKGRRSRGRINSLLGGGSLTAEGSFEKGGIFLDTVTPVNSKVRGR